MKKLKGRLFLTKTFLVTDRKIKSIITLYSIMILIGVLLLSVTLTTCDNSKKIYKVGIINFAPILDQGLPGFKQGMRELGYIEGKNINYIYHGATTDISKLPETCRALLEEKVDLFYTITTPATLAAQKETKNNGIPVVFAVVTDPVGAGIVNSMQHPGGNITGITFGVQEPRRLKWLLQIAPDTRKIYVPYNSQDKSPVLALKILQESAVTLGVTLLLGEYHDSETLEKAVYNIPDEADAIFFLPDSMMGPRYPDIVPVAIKRKMPTSISNITDLEHYNMLTAFGFDQILNCKNSARLVDQIFKGSKPSDLPVETAEFYLAINLKVAKMIGLTIPDKVLRQAQIIIR